MAGTQFPGWSAGDDITAAKLNQGTVTTSWKLTSTSRTSTTATADPELIIDLPVGSFTFEGVLIYTGAGAAASPAGDIKVAFNYTGSTSGNSSWGAMGASTTAANAFKGFGGNIGTSTVSWGTNGGSFAVIAFDGFFEATTTGQLQVMWAENGTSTTPTVVRVASWIRTTQVA